MRYIKILRVLSWPSVCLPFDLLGGIGILLKDAAGEKRTAAECRVSIIPGQRDRGVHRVG